MSLAKVWDKNETHLCPVHCSHNVYGLQDNERVQIIQNGCAIRSGTYRHADIVVPYVAVRKDM